MCVWQMQSTNLTHQQELARVVTANTDRCDQVGFLPLAAMLTSSTTHQSPQLVRAITASLPSLSTGSCHVQGHPAQEIFLCSKKHHHAEPCSTHSYEDGFKPADSQLKKLKGLVALILLTHQTHPPLTQEVNVCCLLLHFKLTAK